MQSSSEEAIYKAPRSSGVGEEKRIIQGEEDSVSGNSQLRKTKSMDANDLLNETTVLNSNENSIEQMINGKLQRSKSEISLNTSTIGNRGKYNQKSTLLKNHFSIIQGDQLKCTK